MAYSVIRASGTHTEYVTDATPQGVIDATAGDMAYDTNGKVWVCTGTTNWTDCTGGATPAAHASSHENGGGDEVSVAGLSGELADDQPPKAHVLDSVDHTISGKEAGMALIASAADAFSFRHPFGSWATLSLETDYQAATDGICTARVHNPGAGVVGHLYGYTDATSPPTVCRCEDSFTGSAAGVDNVQNAGICFPVKKDDYYRCDVVYDVGGGAASYMYWLPIGG